MCKSVRMGDRRWSLHYLKQGLLGPLITACHCWARAGIRRCPRPLHGHVLRHLLVEAIFVVILVPLNELLDALLEGRGGAVAELGTGQRDVCTRLQDVTSGWHGHVIPDGFLTEGLFDAVHQVGYGHG